MNSEIIVPVSQLWFTPKQMDAPVDHMLVNEIKNGYIPQPALVNPLATGRYEVLTNAHIARACIAAGQRTIRVCLSVSAAFQRLRETTDAIKWAEMADQFIKDGYTIDQVVEGSHLPRSVVLDRLALLAPLRAELERAEAHGKVIGRGEKEQEENERRAKMLLMRYGPCAICKEPTPDRKLYENGVCEECTDKVEKQTRSPKDRGLKLCLEPGCKTWIPLKMKRCSDGIVERFCKKHRKMTYESHPLRDRDGDPIWIGAGMNVMKMQDMDVSHVLNCISKMESDARKREELTSKSAKESLAEAPRYALLVAELKQRDACKACRGGLVIYTQLDTKDAQFGFCACKLGQERRAADAIAKQSDGRKRLAIIALMMAFITAMLNAPAIAPSVVEMVHAVQERLRCMGVIR